MSSTETGIEEGLPKRRKKERKNANLETFLQKEKNKRFSYLLFAQN